MEPSRFLLSSRLYIIGLSCLLLGVIFIGISLYLVPVIFFDYSLNLPTSFFKLIYWCLENYSSDQDKILRVIWLVIFGVGFILMLFADICSNYIDKKLLALGRRLRKAERNIIDIKQLLLVLSLVIIFVYGFLQVVNYTFFSSLPKITHRR